MDFEEYKAKRVRGPRDGGCTTCLRGTLHCFNVCVLVIGCAALGVGVWLLVTEFGARKVTPIVGIQLYEVTTYLLIAGGVAVALLAFLGCLGTIRQDKYVLAFYGATLIIAFIVLVIVSGMFFFFQRTLTEHVKTRMKDMLTEQYGVNTKTDPENRRVTDVWDAMQRQLGCCGISGNASSVNSWAFYSTSTLWFMEQQRQSLGDRLGQRQQKVPESCCKDGEEAIAICTGQTYFAGPPNHLNPRRDKLKTTNPYLYTTGCYDRLLIYLYTYTAVVAIVVAVVPLFLIFGMVMSFCLCAKVGSTSPERQGGVISLGKYSPSNQERYAEPNEQQKCL